MFRELTVDLGWHNNEGNSFEDLPVKSKTFRHSTRVIKNFLSNFSVSHVNSSFIFFFFLLSASNETSKSYFEAFFFVVWLLVENFDLFFYAPTNENKKRALHSLKAYLDCKTFSRVIPRKFEEINFKGSKIGKARRRNP